MVDCAFYALILSLIGKQPLAVTSNLNINFVRKAKDEKLHCHTRIIKFGKQICVGDAFVYCGESVVAHATITYVIPKK